MGLRVARSLVPRTAGVALLGLALAVSACGGGATRSAGAPRASGGQPVPRTHVLTPAGDVYEKAGSGRHPYGPTLRVGEAPRARAYIGFELGELPARVIHATLRLYALSASQDGFALAAAPGARWHGQLLTLAAVKGGSDGPRGIGSGALDRGTWTSIDVTSLVRGPRVTFELLPVAPRQVTLASTESGPTAPQLVLETPAATTPRWEAFAGRTAAAHGGAPTVVAAGDIACDPGSATFMATDGTGRECAMRATSQLALGLKPTMVLSLGDNQYEDNAYWKYLASFAPTWGRLKAILRPALGNHEYATPGAAGYFRYFGTTAGDPARGWYSFDLGAWHLIALNSECGHVGGCGPGSPQVQWLKADLAGHRARCTLAFWHEPRFSSGQHGDAEQTATLWNTLAAAGADVVLSGHNHDYERIEPAGATAQGAGGLGGPLSFQSPVPDPRGMREFVVGTGGKNLYGFKHAALAGEVVRNHDTYGVLDLTLRPAGYSWRFVPVGGRSGSFTDSGTGRCH